MLAGTESSEDRKFHLTFRRKQQPKGKKTIIYKVYNSTCAEIKL